MAMPTCCAKDWKSVQQAAATILDAIGFKPEIQEPSSNHSEPGSVSFRSLLAAESPPAGNILF
jgi:hypothetical protein